MTRAKPRLRKQPFDGRAFLFFQILTLTTALTGGAFSRFTILDSLHKPAFMPALPVLIGCWFGVHLLMATAAYLVWSSGDLDRALPLRVYLLQTAMQAVWPVLVFRLQWRLIGFLWTIWLAALVTLTMSGFRYIRPAAYRLLLPCLLWIGMEAYISLGLFLLNDI